jgi:hypothetical protein
MIEVDSDGSIRYSTVNSKDLSDGAELKVGSFSQYVCVIYVWCDICLTTVFRIL